jgi:predicted transcriptional regulator
MSTLTIRLPGDKHERLKALAESRNISMNRLMDELATMALANFDARTRFELRAARGDTKKAIKILERLGFDGDE